MGPEMEAENGPYMYIQFDHISDDHISDIYCRLYFEFRVRCRILNDIDEIVFMS